MTAEEFAYYDNAIRSCNDFRTLTTDVYSKMYAHQYSDYKEFSNFMTLNGRLDRIKVPLFAFGSHDDVILS